MTDPEPAPEAVAVQEGGLDGERTPTVPRSSRWTPTPLDPTWVARDVRGFRRPRCSTCALPPPLCLCTAFPPLEAPLRITIVMPASEARSASNTARLLAHWLRGTERHIRGEPALPAAPPLPGAERPRVDDSRPLFDVPPARSALLFPDDGPAPLEASLDRTPPVTPANLERLIVPDGTWSQARRVARRDLGALALPRLGLGNAWPSSYCLRRRPQGLCTFEAVAIALGLLGAPALALELLARFQLWHARQLAIKRGDATPLRPEPHPARAALLELAHRSAPPTAAQPSEPHALTARSGA